MHYSCLSDAIEGEFQRLLFTSVSSLPPFSWYTNPLLRIQEPRSSRNWLHLPMELTLLIFEKLGAIEVLTAAQRVCMLWRTICKDPYTWRVINMRVGVPKFMDYQYRSLCRRTIERSCGLVVDINIDYFADDDLLNHIANSCGSRLRRLRINQCFTDISDKVWCDLAKKFPLLEELDITHCYRITAITLESFGQACPLLKTFKFNYPQWLHHYSSDWFRYADNEYAYAIARSMPQLRHLQLLENQLDYDGLHAVLNGCPHLESLDLRYCINLDTKREIIIKILQERIMDFRLPVPGALSTRDYEFGSLLRYEEALRDWDFAAVVGDWHTFQASIKNEKIAKLGLVVKYEDEEVWEDIDMIWVTMKNRRRHRRESINNFNALQRSRRRKEHRTVSKGNKHGEKASKIDLRSMCFGEELQLLF